MVEVWKDIIIKQNGVLYDFTGLYQVSNLGNIKSLGNGKTKKEKILKLGKHDRGYLQVGLSLNRKRQMFKVHRLVATMFIPNPNNLSEVNHKNEIKTDNRVENLEWCDKKYNINYGTGIQRSVEKRRKYIHEQNPNEKHSIKVICVETGKIYGSTKKAADILGLSRISIWKCCMGQHKTCGGYHWKYYADYLLNINEKNEQLLAELKVA